MNQLLQLIKNWWVGIPSGIISLIMQIQDDNHIRMVEFLKWPNDIMKTITIAATVVIAITSAWLNTYKLIDWFKERKNK